MKANLFVCGVYQGEIEVGNDSIIGLLARMDYGGALQRITAMQEELNQLAGGEQPPMPQATGRAPGQRAARRLSQ